MINTILYSSKTPEWGTPIKLFMELHREFNFTLDPASTAGNAKCEKFYTEKEDGLAQSWEGERVFLNPPYGRIVGKWIKKASESKAKIVVALLPARTDTQWFHKYIYGKAEVRFLEGRIKFEGGKHSAPFPSMVVIWRN